MLWYVLDPNTRRYRLVSKFLQEGACKVILDKYPEPTKYLDTAIFDGWGHYSGISVPDENKISTNRALGYKRAFLRTEIARLTQQMEIIQGDISTETLDSSDAYKDLIAAMKGANEKSLKKLQPIEDWAETYRRANDVESKSKKRRKFDFFADKALFMAPPIDRETLERMECFHAAVAAASGPSERAWKSVEKKLQAQLAKTAASLAMVEENNRPSQEEYRALVKRREDNNTSEQVAILALADEVLKSLVEGPDSIRVADEDFVRIVLKRTYELHQENKGEEGYALLMDDASMIFKRKIEPIIKGWQDGTKKRAALGLRCPGCKKGTKQTYTFDKLIHHIFWKHSGRIGDYDCFRFGKESSDEFRTRSEFLWCYIKWPRNLPILSAGQNAGGAWDIHAAVEEHYSPPSSRSVEPDPSVGAFDNRLATNCVGSKSPNLVNDIQFILDRFESIDLPDRFKTQIALEFACQRFETQDKHEPPLSLLKDLRLMLLRKGFKGVFERFRCRVCCDETREDGRNGYFARSLKSLDQLSDHFRSEHSKHCWTREMLDLPTPQELLTELQQPSNHEACTLFDCFFPSIPSATLDPNVQHVAAADTIESMDSEMFDDSEEESESAEEHEDMEESEDSYAIYNYQDFAKHQERGVSPG